MTRVSHAEPTAEAELRQRRGELFGQPGLDLQEPPDRDLETGGVEDLRPDVRMQPAQVEDSGRQDPPRSLDAGIQRQAKLLVLMGRGDVFMRVCLHPDLGADHDRRFNAELRGQGGKTRDLGRGVQHDLADTDLQRLRELVIGLVVAVQREPMRREPGRQRDGEFAAGAHVER